MVNDAPSTTRRRSGARAAASVPTWTRLPADVAERLAAQAEREQITRAAVMRRAVVAYLNEAGA